MAVWAMVVAGGLILVALLRSGSRRRPDAPVSNGTHSSDTPTPVGIHVPSSTSEQLEAERLRNRRDPARQAWQQSPDKYQDVRNPAADPLCPFCKREFSRKTVPTRRSKFNCGNCGQVISADPHQRIFPSVYLNDVQALTVGYLQQMAYWGYFAARNEDFWWQAQQKDWTRNKNRLTDSEAADVLWGLFNYNVLYLQQIAPAENDQRHADRHAQLQRLMKDYRAEESALKKEKGDQRSDDASKSSRDARIRLICPYCEEDLGLVPRPSRRSKRKCKQCGERIHVNPRARLFDSPFLSEREDYLDSVLSNLDGWVFTKGEISDFDGVKERLGFTGDLDLGDKVAVLRELIVENIEVAKDFAADRRKQEEALMGDMDEETRKMIFEPGGSYPLDHMAELVEQMLSRFDGEIESWNRIV